MSENNKSYRIRTNVEGNVNTDLKLDVNLIQDYDEFEILSLKIATDTLYKLHTSKYGCIVGRVLANGGVGIPNAKLSIFVSADNEDLSDNVLSSLYPYVDANGKNKDNIRYNLLTDKQINDCHQNVGTFPNKRLVLDDDNVIEIFDKYYKYTTTTNGSGDYMIFGVPVGNNILHSDLDLSDIGILSQKPRDLFYKGYTATQFENASKFKSSTNLDNLTQIYSQNSSVYVYPFWGEESESDIKITRFDIDINYKFEPTCVFLGCIVSDEKSNAISKRCIPHERMGKMDRLTTGKGTIEMIRKTLGGDTESIMIQGNELIDGNGTWCYQIPMNLDYKMTDEYGNLVPTSNTDIGIPTRTKVRFRVSLADYESDSENAHLVKVLVPNNPSNKIENGEADKDEPSNYAFGDLTPDSDFRDLFWNNVYTVKSHIPRFQKGNRQRNKNFTGFKAVNVNGSNNPIPYNNMRINLTFLFSFQCLIFKSVILIVKTLNKLISVLNVFACCSDYGLENGLVYITIDGGICPTLDGNFVAPGAKNDNKHNIIKHTYQNVIGEDYEIKANKGETLTVDGGTAKANDEKSSDNKNTDVKKVTEGVHENMPISFTNEDDDTESVKIFNNEDYFIKCVELQFAMEYEVIQFDFYNDWVNGMIYIPRWFAEIKKNKENMYYCGETFLYNRNLVQQCALKYNSKGEVQGNLGCDDNSDKQRCHKKAGRVTQKIFGETYGGIVKAYKNRQKQYAYYLRPIEYNKDHKKINLFNTDIVLLGSLNECNEYGLPKAVNYPSSTYLMPPPTGMIVSDTQEMNLKNGVNGGILISKVNDKLYEIFDETKWYQTAYPAKKQTVREWCVYYKYPIDNLISEINKQLNIIVNCDMQDPVFTNAKLNIKNSINLFKCYHDGRGFSDVTDKFFKRLVGLNGTDIYLDGVKGNGKNNKNVQSYAIKSGKYTSNDFHERGVYGKFDRLCDGYGDKEKSLYQEIELVINEVKKTVISGDKNIYQDDVFFKFNKKDAKSANNDEDKANLNEGTDLEISGIDWGYNPFTDGGNEDKTNKVEQQIAGHFLEIGCSYSLSNIKSCVNLSRICEIGSEMSQSHYYNDNKKFLSPSGIISKREVSDTGIRTSFALLNSKPLIFEDNQEYYNFIGYTPTQFGGELTTKIDSWGDLKSQYGVIEGESLSYRMFRFGVNNYNEIKNKFLINKDKTYQMPVYENSFYFYFGLKDGNTAIDRLYNEFYAECENKSDIKE